MNPVSKLPTTRGDLAELWLGISALLVVIYVFVIHGICEIKDEIRELKDKFK